MRTRFHPCPLAVLPMPRSRWLQALGVALLLTACQDALGGGAAPQEPSAITAIRTLYADVNAALERQGVKGERYCGEGDAWHRVSARQASEESDCTPIATAFQLDGKLRKVVIEDEAVSGDWSNRVEYYFYEDGKTAFRFERLLTYYGGVPGEDESGPGGPYIVETRTYYGQDGRQLRELKRASFESTGKELSPQYVQQRHDPRYRAVAELPFVKGARTRR